MSKPRKRTRKDVRTIIMSTVDNKRAFQLHLKWETPSFSETVRMALRKCAEKEGIR